MFQAGLLAGKRILITGGGTGLGKSIGRRYAELGAELVICGRRLDVLQATAAEMEQEIGAKVTAISCDVIKSLAVEWGPKGIRLVGVAPGPFPTEGAWSRLRPEGANRKPAEAAIPLGRVGRHEELADLCAYLASDQAGFITGEIIAIDGGKQHTGGGGVGTTEMLAWTDADWERIRPPKKNN